MTDKKTLLSGIFLVLLGGSTLMQLAAAQSYPGPDTKTTLEESLKLAQEKVKEVKQHPGAGSGTPYLDANGVIGASIITAGVFGGIFAAFVVKAKKAQASLAKMR